MAWQSSVARAIESLPEASRGELLRPIEALSTGCPALMYRVIRISSLAPLTVCMLRWTTPFWPAASSTLSIVKRMIIGDPSTFLLWFSVPSSFSSE